jgi:hypothetical protein
MTLTSLAPQAWRFVPPLDLPLALRLENGRFGVLRPSPLAGAPPCATTQVVPASDPRNPTGADVHVANGLHEAVDLAAAAGDCVFAAYSGRVVSVETNPAQTRGRVMIDHHPPGRGFLTKYDHVTAITVAPGDFLQKGTPFAAVSAEPAEPHLHFELWTVADPAGVDVPGGPGDGDLLPLDPTRALYAWEQLLAPDAALAGGARVPASIGLVRLSAVPFFRAVLEGGGEAPAAVHVPLYEPVAREEELVIELLGAAHREGRAVSVRARASRFWGVDVATQVELA